MKITKRQLRRIIRESLPGSGRNPNVDEGIWRGTYQGIWDYLEAEFDQAMTGEDTWTNPVYAESIADALEAIAIEVRGRVTEK